MPDPGKSELLAWPGAVQASWPDEGVAAHYGDPMREQRAIEESAGVVDRSNRGVLRITGLGESAVEDRLRDLMRSSVNPTIAPYAHTGECHVRVTARGGDAEVEAMLRKQTEPDSNGAEP